VQEKKGRGDECSGGKGCSGDERKKGTDYQSHGVGSVTLSYRLIKIPIEKPMQSMTASGMMTPVTPWRLRNPLAGDQGGGSVVTNGRLLGKPSRHTADARNYHSIYHHQTRVRATVLAWASDSAVGERWKLRQK